jgi:hypothetical protein
VSAPRITYVPRPNSTQEAQLNAVASVYRLILDSRAKNAAGADNTDGDDAKGSQLVRAKDFVQDQT